jgi:hypothetical protein
MTITLKNEIENLIQKYNLDMSVENFSETLHWRSFQSSATLSLEFIRYFQNYLNWTLLSKNPNLSLNIFREFKNKFDWYYISLSQNRSEEFIDEFHNYVKWYSISKFQKLSPRFIEKYKNKVDWNNICTCQNLPISFIKRNKDYIHWSTISISQTLSESCIERFKNKIDWINISCYQNLSEDFIRKYQNQVSWYHIYQYQNISKKFIEEFKDKFDNISVILKEYDIIHQVKTRTKKIIEMRKYAKKYNLKFDGKYLYAFRDHDKRGKGMWKFSIQYENGKYYRDWHCDMRPDIENSFGLGIWPSGNTPVKVSVDDWGLYVSKTNGKCRVWGFTVIGDRKES